MVVVNPKSHCHAQQLEILHGVPQEPHQLVAFFQNVASLSAAETALRPLLLFGLGRSTALGDNLWKHNVFERDESILRVDDDAGVWAGFGTSR